MIRYEYKKFPVPTNLRTVTEDIVIDLREARDVCVLIKDNHMIISGGESGILAIEMGRGILEELIEIESVYKK